MSGLMVCVLQTELKDGCLGLVSRNQEMERTLEERKL